MSVFDITFEVGVNTPQRSQPEGEEAVPAVFEHQATVIMSPQHFKAFAVLVANNLQRYEELFGSISIESKSKHD